MAKQPETLEQLEHTVKRNIQVTTALIVVFILQAAIFLFIGYQRAQALTKPENIADLGQDYLEEHYQELRELLKQEVKQAGPALAKQISKQVRKSLPEARAEVKQLVMREFERAIASGTSFSAEQFRELLQANRQTFVQAFEEVKELPRETEQVVLDLEKLIEKQLDVDIQKRARDILAVHRAINDKLEYLASDQSLEPQELLERRILRLARTIQLEEIGKLP